MKMVFSNMRCFTMLESCRLCPRSCGVDRTQGGTGWCRAPLKPKVARAALHFWEEPCLSGDGGSGAVFFAHCNLKCVYCQNYQISQDHSGTEVDIPNLASIFLDLERQGAHNINLVSPTPYIPQVAEAIKSARSQGLKVPLVYNSNGYDEVAALTMLEGLIDIYLPDLKYTNTTNAREFSGASDYFPAATKAILEMYRQVGSPHMDQSGLMKKGLLIRHLMLPGQLDDTLQVLQWIAENLPREVGVSLMAQYFPTYQASELPPLNRRLTRREYDKAVNALLDLDLETGYVQELSAADECFVPAFDGSGITKK